MNTIELQRAFFTEEKKILIHNPFLTVQLFRYPSGVEAVEVINTRGRMVVLPYMGQMIWDLEFDHVDLKMKNMFNEPKQVKEIIDTYGCFSFHSGLIRNGCPAPEDDHVLHGEMACATMDQAWIEILNEGIRICGRYEYVKGFGHHYIAEPTVTMYKNESYIDIQMNVKNESGYEMPLQYMCHTNYAYLEGAVLSESIPSGVFQLRKSIPAHVKPTEQWLQYNSRLANGEEQLTILNQPEMYDPEIVFFADQLKQYGTDLEFRMENSSGCQFFTSFSTDEFNYATRWILYNEDQQVGAFVLPATCRPEGFLAAEKAGSLLMLQPGEQRSFTVRTGKK